MDLYAAVVTTAPFLLLALLAEVKIFGPVAGRTRRRTRRQDHRTDRSTVLFLGAGFAVSLVALTTGWDHPVLRFMAAMPLAVAAFALGLGVLRSIEATYDTPPSG